MRSLRLALIAAILAACGPVAGSPAASGSPQPAVALVRPTPTPTETSGCPATTPVTAEHPKNSNTAAFSRGWYVSPDRLLWASASGPFVVGSNKVLWERPGPAVAVTGKLLSGDAKAAGVPTITGPAGYETSDYQASSVTFPVAGCWEVEARAQTSVLDFVVFVVPR
jgi:hypothetical protein